MAISDLKLEARVIKKKNISVFAAHPWQKILWYAKRS
jgi:hypothetical protein